MSFTTRYSGICFLFVISSARLASGAKQGNCECGVSPEAYNRIVGGWNAIPNEFPWLAAIYNLGQVHCGGALINDRYILTAGHCVRWTKDADLLVVLGLHNTRIRDGRTFKILKSLIHADFISHNLFDENDIALIKLQEPVRYTEKISPICLPKKEIKYDNVLGTVAGWGKLNEHGDYNGPLQQTVVKILAKQACNKTKMRRYQGDFVVCAYTHESDACQGDSGGPLIADREPGRSVIMGIVSWGLGCGNHNSPGMYTKVTYFLHWIYKNTEDAIYCANTHRRNF